MNRQVGDVLYWWEGSGTGGLPEERGPELKSSTVSVCSGKVVEVDEENQRYWVETEDGRRVEMDDVSGHGSEEEAKRSASAFWGQFPRE